MNTRTLFIALVALALFSAPVLADGMTKEDKAALEQFNAVPALPMPTAQDSMGDALAKSDLASTELSIAPEEPKENVKYVYKGYAENTLGRPIRDYRVDDGYVQGLLLQRGSE